MALAHPLSAPVSAVPDLEIQWVPELSWCTSSFSPFKSVGCYNDTGSFEALPMRSAADQYAMTQEECWAICKGNAFRYAGLTYGGVCYCGPTLQVDKVDSGNCNMACSGNADQTCGGHNYLSVFEDTTFPSTAGLTTNDYAPIGCWADNLSGGRALGYEQDQLSGDSLTTEMCIQACLDLGFPYAERRDLLDQLYFMQHPCNGNRDEMCGGGGAISVYHCEELESLEPCGSNILPPPKSSSTTSVSSSSSTSVSSASPPTLPPPTSTSKPSTSTPPTSTPKPPTSTPQPPPPPTSTPKPPTTTPKPPTTATPKPPTTMTSGGLCTATLVTPPKCEYKCGEKFCSLPLRTWDDEQGCTEAYSACKLQVPGCFKNAGWPNAMDCFNFHEWCTTIKYYCKKKSYYGSEFGKDHCFKNYPRPTAPTRRRPASTRASRRLPQRRPRPHRCLARRPRPATASSPATTSTATASKSLWARFGCLSSTATMSSLSTEVLYTHQDSNKCSSWKRQHTPDACEAACKQQYSACKDTYARGCKNDGKDEQNKEYGKGYPGHHRKGKGGGKWGGGHHGGGGKGKGGKGKGGHGGKGKGEYFEYAADSAHTAALEARTHERWQNDGHKAEEACTQQYRDCVAINRDLKVPKDKCVKYGFF
ncbi:glyoxal oxidase precursor [Apiospora hydei]|uniref:Glyoxal oxidase n=1 Tax=Apiospora hydei TaxID=1337664 RepID=A0ABR1V5N4_9PEZI